LRQNNSAQHASSSTATASRESASAITGAAITRDNLFALQRAAGNAAVLRLVHDAGHGDPAPSAVTVADAVAQRAPAGMPGKLTDDINRVLDDTVGAARTDAKMLAAILKKIKTDPVNERVIARTDPRIVRRLPVDLTRSSALTVLRGLQATLTQRLPTATAAGVVAPTLAGITKEIAAAPAAERKAVLAEPSLLAGIEVAVTRAQSLTALATLGAGLRELLNAGMRGAAGAETVPMLRAAAAAPAGEKSAVLADGATRTQLAARLTRSDNLKMLGALGAPFVDQLNATVTGPGAADGATAFRLATAARFSTRLVDAVFSSPERLLNDRSGWRDAT